GATSAAEPLLPATLRCPGAQPLLAREQAKRTSLGPGVGRGGRAAAPLTARAVAVVAETSGAVTSNRTARHAQPPVKGRSGSAATLARKDTVAGLDVGVLLVTANAWFPSVGTVNLV